MAHAKPHRPSPTRRLADLDHRHLWHPFTAMRQWREQPPLIIERAQGFHLVDTQGKRYIDGVSSLWCNVHGHRVPAIDQAIREQLDKVAHSTLLGLSARPAIELADRLVHLAPRGKSRTPKLTKVFYSDSGATALEIALKMAVGYWHHTGQPRRTHFLAMAGAYHGDTVGSMSVGYSEIFHKPYRPLLFPTYGFPAPDAARAPHHLPRDPSCSWPSHDPVLQDALAEYCIEELRILLRQHRHEIAAVVIEPVMQGAAGMICQPPGFMKRVAQAAREFDTLLIADEVATGFGRTGGGKMFACDLDAPGVTPDILCLAKGITGGYLPLAATLATDRVESAFCGELDERRTLYHGHTYTGNALACAAALASLDLFAKTKLLDHITESQRLIAQRLQELVGYAHVLDVRQRGLMVGIELGEPGGASASPAKPFDFAARDGQQLCLAMRKRGLILRPLGNVLVLMPIPAMDHPTLHRMLDIVIETLRRSPPA